MSNIIGIIFEKNNGPWPRIDIDGNSIAPTPSEFDTHPTYAGIAIEEIDGQHMAHIPAFYYRAGKVESGEHAGKKALWISPDPVDGFALHPAFRDNGIDLTKFWFGAYQGTPDGSNEKMGSKPGLKPLTNIDFNEMRAAAAARNAGDVSGFMLFSIYQIAAIQALVLIECGTPDVKSVLGTGYVNGDGVREVDYSDQVKWRGIVGLWGNVWQMVDGLQTNDDGEYLVWDINGHKTFVETDVEAPGDGWFRRRTTESGPDFDLGAVFLPSSTRSNRSEAPYGNYFWSSTNSVAYYGGYWGGGERAGLFPLDVACDASISYSYIGGRLAKV